MTQTNELRSQCFECPWRTPRQIPDDVREHAKTDPTGFVCHTRLGPCDGPTYAAQLVGDSGSL